MEWKDLAPGRRAPTDTDDVRGGGSRAHTSMRCLNSGPLAVSELLEQPFIIHSLNNYGMLDSQLWLIT